MIVTMKRVHVILQQKDRGAALEVLRELGTVHVQPQEAPQAGALAEQRQAVKRLRRVVGVLKNLKVDVVQKSCPDWNDKADAILGWLEAIKGCQEALAKRQHHILQWEPWGDFEPEGIADLRAQSLQVQLCEVPQDLMASLPAEAVVQEISTVAGKARCVIITQNAVALPVEPLALPAIGLSALRLAQEEDHIQIEQAEKCIHDSAHYLDVLEGALLEQEDELRFQEVALSARQDQELIILKGYCPAEACTALSEKAREASWGLTIDAAPEEEPVPTLLRNPKWVGLVKPLLKMINIVPGYKELDVSAVFLIFFALFVGMLVGDAGYGALIAAAFAGVHFKCRKGLKDPTLFYLIYLLCGCAVAWGVLTGTYFGQHWLNDTLPPLAPWLRDNMKVQGLCFTIGAIHLSIAHGWRALVKWPSRIFLGEVGWLLIVWGMFFLAKTLVMGASFPANAQWLFMAGTGLIVLFSSPQRNVLKAMGAGLGDFLLNIINSFTDVVSYIRLFAVGLATVAVADAANEMSFFWVIFLHTLNILLAAMAILVHGLRLNVLEFSGHLSMAWDGLAYKPFTKTQR